jgi:hypothetical protein
MLSVLAAPLASAQSSSPAGPAASAVPRLADGRPDLSGVWQRPYVPDMTRTFQNQQGPGELPYTPAGAQKFKNYDVTKFDYTGHCLPQGMTRSMNSPFPIEIIQTPNRVAILFEAWNVFHVIPTDGRAFPVEIEEQMHLTQRFTRTDEKHMAYEVIIDDPVFYTKPWKNLRTFTLRPDWELMEYSCMENNKDLLDGHIK